MINLVVEAESRLTNRTLTPRTIIMSGTGRHAAAYVSTISTISTIPAELAKSTLHANKIMSPCRVSVVLTM